MRIILFLLILQSLFTTGCSERQNVNKSDIEFREVQADTFYLKSRILPIDIVSPAVIISIDTFLVFLSTHEQKMASVYNLKTNEYITSFLGKGNGPDDVISLKRPIQFVHEDGQVKVWINAYPTFLGLLNINKSVEQDKTVFDCQYRFHGNLRTNLFAQSNGVFCFQDSILWMSINSVLSNQFEHNPNNVYLEYDYANSRELSTICTRDFWGLKQKDAIIVSETNVCHLSRPKVASFYNYLGCFNILDLENKTYKKIETHEDGANYHKALNNIVKEHIIGAASKDHIWMIRGFQNDNTVVFIYDWDGNFSGTVLFDKPFNKFHINTCNNKLHAVGQDDEILEYDLSSINI